MPFRSRGSYIFLFIYLYRRFILESTQNFCSLLSIPNTLPLDACSADPRAGWRPPLGWHLYNSYHPWTLDFRPNPLTGSLFLSLVKGAPIWSLLGIRIPGKKSPSSISNKGFHGMCSKKYLHIFSLFLGHLFMPTQSTACLVCTMYILLGCYKHIYGEHSGVFEI